MSTTQRNAAQAGAAVTLSLRDPIAVRAALIRELVSSAHLVADLAGQHTLDPLNTLDDDIEITLERTLSLASNLLTNIVAIEATGVFEAADGTPTEPPPPPASPHTSTRTRSLSAPASLAGLALLTHAAHRRHRRHRRH